MYTNGLFIKNLSRWIGGTIFCSGLLVIVSWYEHWQRVLQLVPDTAPMQFNTALCFIVSGLSLFLLTTTRAGVVPYLGGLLGILTTLTLLEYVMGRTLGIDLLFYKPYFEVATTFPGRMSPLAAVCFIMIAIGLMLASPHHEQPYRLAIVGVLTCVVAVIAFVALIGFIFGIEYAYGWGSYSSMAVNTAAMFLVLDIGLLLFALDAGWQQNYNFLHWLPTVASVTLMIMVAFVAAGDFKGLNAATYWRKHTIETILSAQSFENDLIDLQRGMRTYVTGGDRGSLVVFHNTMTAERLRLKELTELTQDNPTQQETLKRFAAAIETLFTYDDNLTALYDRKGADAVVKAEASGQGRLVFGRAHDVLKEFSQAEQKLLSRRDDSEATSYRNTERLLVVSCTLAAGLLLLANFIASHELAKRRLAEARLEARAQALRRSNAELEQFAYVASHDMREPLRSVSGFAQILKRHAKDTLDAKSNDTIDRIVDGARRLATIIDDLLALSSIRSQRKPFEQTPLEKPLQQALENLSVTIRERGAVVRRDELPTLPVDSSQLMLLFQNLIGNAIKFCTSRKPEIRVAAVKEPGGVWRISVQDNGIGIEPKHFDKIFGIFQRLHTREQYAGTGIGLAICKKIIERHGGQIWLESTPDVGTTFYFTLAEQQPEKYDES